jgi:hypothetical protein
MRTRGTSHSRLMRRARSSSDAGLVTVWTLGVLAACVAMAGLVLDGGTVLRARSAAFDLAGGAARAAAQELDQPALAQGFVVLDQDRARSTALRWLAARDAAGSVAVDADRVSVTVHREVRLQLLRPATVAVTETATVQARRGSTS